MKIFSLSNIKYPAMSVFTTLSLGHSLPLAAPSYKIAAIPDRFEKVVKIQNPVDKYTQEDLPAVFREAVNPSGWTVNKDTLKMAPSPKIKIIGKDTLASVVVDITHSILFRYDKQGKVIEAFKAATGAPSTPTPVGIAKIVGKLTYPYSTLPRKCKRRRFPRNYGPKILLTYKINPKTGKLHDDGVYPHGTKFENAIDKGHITGGCTRVHNRDILYLSDILEKGMYVLFTK